MPSQTILFWFYLKADDISVTAQSILGNKTSIQSIEATLKLSYVAATSPPLYDCY